MVGQGVPYLFIDRGIVWITTQSIKICGCKTYLDQSFSKVGVVNRCSTRKKINISYGYKMRFPFDSKGFV